MVFAIFRLENFRVRPGTRVKPHPPFPVKVDMKKGWDYTRVSTELIYNGYASFQEISIIQEMLLC